MTNLYSAPWNLVESRKHAAFPMRFELTQLQPFDGILSFHVFKMNVQRGGILSYSRDEGEAFTMK